MAVATGVALASAAIGAAGSVYAADSAAKGGADASKFELARLANLTPYVRAGKGALADYQEGINVNYDDLVKNVESDPFYQFQRSEGIKGIEGSAAANGLLRSGRTLKDLTSFGQGLASSSVNAAYGRNIDKQNQLMSLIQTGANAGGAQSNLANIAMQGGQNQADKYTNLANVGTSSLQNLMLARQLQGGGGFTGVAGGGSTPMGGGYSMAGGR